MSSGMGANTRSKALSWLAALAAAALVAVLLVTLLRGEDAPEDMSGREEKVAAPGRDSPSPGLPPPGPSVAPPGVATVTDAGVTPGLVSEAPPSDATPTQHPVDLEKLRERLPGNLYWELGAPTKDPEVLRKRAEETQRWNTLFGKVQSNTATEEEIHQYYDHRRQVSEDYIAFASMVLQEYGAQLSEQERGLYELSIQMHRTRLSEMPGKVDDALARARLQNQRRETWRGNEGGH
ncbi:hypothetical protein [Archangium lipolyticum]|uniref:hypothetical protein n=1 Tax=Archangium lipolyticum TaxID=2970465 RepID=UPI00214A2F45|nr:hypothetical protein [Archangium lipolyticum]